MRLLHLLIVACLLIALGPSRFLRAVRADTDGKAMNVVVILVDDLGWRDLGCYGATYYETPHIDRIAAEGVLCTKFYAATPVCSPSRSSFISGQYPQNTPVTNNNLHLSDDGVTSDGEALRSVEVKADGSSLAA